MNLEDVEFEEFLRRREAASLDYVRGHPDSFAALVAQQLPASFFSPGGGYTRGTHDVSARYERDASAFGSDTPSSTFEVFHCAASNGVAYWTGLQHAVVQLRAADKLIPMKLRVTEVFRREGNEWKIVHRHADMLSEAPPRS